MKHLTDEEYIADAKSRLECNMSKEDIEVLGAFLYTEEEVDNNKEYFLKCKESGMSAYKALVFFSFHLGEATNTKKETKILNKIDYGKKFQTIPCGKGSKK